MQISPQNLSDNPQELKIIIHDLIKQFQQKDTQLSQKETELDQKNNELKQYVERIVLLEHQLRAALQFRFGKKSEKSSSHQLGLFDEAVLTEEETGQAIAAEVAISVAPYTRSKSGRKPLPKDLPREQIIHDLLDAEKVCACGSALHKMGEDKSEQLEFIPAQVKVLEHVRYKYACRNCEEGVKVAALPSQPIPKSIATPGLLAHILVSKYNDHIPLYRQEHILQRHDIDLARSTLCHWVLSCGELFQPLIDLIKEQILKHHYLCVDETPVQVLPEKGKGKAKVSNSYMWSYLTGPPKDRFILYDYQSSRAGAAVTTYLKDFKGYLQTDGYAGYNALQSQPHIIAVGCWAHARRKFVEIIKTNKKARKAIEAVKSIKQLYEIESEAKAKQLTPEATQQLRQEKAKPLLENFKLWLEETLLGVPPQSPIAKAIQYTLNQWSSLITYLEHGELMIDNNAVENAIRPFALGRKNWLFIGNERGGKAAANIYSLIMTAKANQIEPYRYLRYLLTQLPICKTPEQLHLLLPQHCKDKLL